MKQSEDHMDELFRKVGENYPLKTDTADWDKVLAGLQQAPQGEPVTLLGMGKKSTYRKLWWLTLLLPLVFVCNNYTGNFYNRWIGQAKTTSPAAATGANAGSAAGAATATAQPATKPSAARSAGPATPSVATPSAGLTTLPIATRSVATPSVAAHSAARSVTTPSAATHSAAPATPLVTASSASSAGPVSSAIVGTASVNTGAIRKDSLETPNTPTVNTSTANTPTANTPIADAPAANVPAADTSASSAASAAKTTTPDTAVAIARNKLADSSASKKHPSITKAKQHGLYGGFLLGPDISTIKGQKIQDPGYSVGIVVGFRFNRHIAVETGALWDHKNYYTSGEYFDTKRTNIPSGTEINYLNGYCNMIELPLSFRWDFLQFNNSGLYITCGLSSYLMKKEYYNYNATNAGYTWSGASSYLNSGNSFFSMVHFSAGYTFKWDHIGDVRLEPYWNIPMTGVGIGRMSIMSTGLYLGITHPFR